MKNNLPNWINISFLFLFFFVGIYQVNGTIVEKPLNISISNCYNVTIFADLNNGKETDVYFTNCNKLDSYNFYCDCFNINRNNFSIIMQTDNYPVRDLREYDIKIKATYFNFNSKSINVPVTDAGEYYILENSEWKDLGAINKTQYRIIEKVVYVNNTIEVPVEKIVYQDREIIKTEYINVTVPEYIYINNTQYIENTTKINELKYNLVTKNYWIISLILFIIVLCILFYINVIKIKKVQ